MICRHGPPPLVQASPHADTTICVCACVVEVELVVSWVGRVTGSGEELVGDVAVVVAVDSAVLVAVEVAVIVLVVVEVDVLVVVVGPVAAAVGAAVGAAVAAVGAAVVGAAVDAGVGATVSVHFDGSRTQCDVKAVANCKSFSPYAAVFDK